MQANSSPGQGGPADVRGKDTGQSPWPAHLPSVRGFCYLETGGELRPGFDLPGRPDRDPARTATDVKSRWVTTQPTVANPRRIGKSLPAYS